MAAFDRTPVKTATARRLRREMTDAERRLWNRLRSGQMEGFSFRRQHPVGSYVLDFYCPKARLAIELDGGQHGEPEHEARDRKRDAWLSSNGIAVLRFWNGEVTSSLEGVWETIRHETLQRVRTSPSKGEVGAQRREGIGAALMPNAATISERGGQ